MYLVTENNEINNTSHGLHVTTCIKCRFLSNQFPDGKVHMQW